MPNVNSLVVQPFDRDIIPTSHKRTQITALNMTDSKQHIFLPLVYLGLATPASARSLRELFPSPAFHKPAKKSQSSHPTLGGACFFTTHGLTFDPACAILSHVMLHVRNHHVSQVPILRD